MGKKECMLKVIDSNNENILKSKEIMLMEETESLKYLALFLKDAFRNRSQPNIDTKKDLEEREGL